MVRFVSTGLNPNGPAACFHRRPLCVELVWTGRGVPFLLGAPEAMVCLTSRPLGHFVVFCDSLAFIFHPLDALNRRVTEDFSAFPACRLFCRFVASFPVFFPHTARCYVAPNLFCPFCSFFSRIHVSQSWKPLRTPASERILL